MTRGKKGKLVDAAECLREIMMHAGNVRKYVMEKTRDEYKKEFEDDAWDRRGALLEVLWAGESMKKLNRLRRDNPETVGRAVAEIRHGKAIVDARNTIAHEYGAGESDFRKEWRMMKEIIPDVERQAGEILANVEGEIK